MLTTTKDGDADILCQGMTACVRPERGELIHNYVDRTSGTAALLPCCNEEAAIERTVVGFHAASPSASIYVSDYSSRDRILRLACGRPCSALRPHPRRRRGG